MEFAVYVTIGVGCVSVIVSIIGLFYWVYDNKRRERQEQEEAAPASAGEAVPQ